MNIPDEIEHNGKTLQRLTDIPVGHPYRLPVPPKRRCEVNIPDEIEHDGKTLKRLPRIEDVTQDDWVMISNELFPVSKYDGDFYVLSGLLSRFLRVIQAQYREKKSEVYPWIPKATGQCIMRMEEWEEINHFLTKEYGSPAELMRKGAESAIVLTEDDWQMYEQNHRKTYAEGSTRDLLVTQALANCRPKGGAK